jgi:hypothetical protein
MRIDMEYNGTVLSWHGTKFKATSGMFGAQRADFQSHPDHGPIPEGTYKLLAKDVGGVKSVNGDFVFREGIETLPPNPLVIAAWGNIRVHLAIVHINRGDSSHRNGFYIHDSHKGFTHGCIEVESAFFTKLRAFAAKTGQKLFLGLKVAYATPSTSTNGGTLF